MGEEKVYFAGSNKNFLNLVDLDVLQFWIKVETAELWNEILQVRPRSIQLNHVREVWVKSDAHKQVISMGFMPVELNKSIEHLTVNKALFLQSLQGPPKVIYHASVSPLFFIVCRFIIDKAAAEQVVSYPEYGSQHREAPEILLVHLLKG